MTVRTAPTNGGCLAMSCDGGGRQRLEINGASYCYLNCLPAHACGAAEELDAGGL